MDELNVNALCARLSRAIEIAKVGNFKLCVIFDRSYENAYDDYKLIKNYYTPFFGNFVTVREADMVVEVRLDYRYATNGCTYETLADIQKRVGESCLNKLPKTVLNKESEKLVETAIEKAKISILQVEKVKRIASVIAKMEGSDVVCTTHVAETLQYQMFSKDCIDPANSGLYQAGRRVGNTTRLVDMFVQDFFNDGECRVYDHYYSRRAYQRVFNLVLQRLNREHGIEEEDVILDRNRFTIRKK